MNGLPYYKAYPRDFIEGTIGMPFEIKCAYRVVLDLIYMQGGRLPDDARYISGLLGCTMRKWTSIRETLIELETLAKLQDKQRENASGPRKNKGLEKPRLRHTEPEPDKKSVVPNGTTSPEPDKSAPAERPAIAAELPTVSGEMVPIHKPEVEEWQAAFPAVDVRQQLAAIRAWLNANPTRRKTKRGMRRFVVAWLDREQNRGGRPSLPLANGHGPPTHAEQVNAALDRIINGKSHEPPTNSTSNARGDVRSAEIPLRGFAITQRH
jgi:uncharacterized protein YdaU (DUF1376 family)